jgi:glycosidase
MSHWSTQSVFYHIYPLGLCGAPAGNDGTLAPVPRLEKLTAWSGYLRDLGINAVYLGPLFESSTHGYDTADYFHLDRRLGTDENLRSVVAQFHADGIRVIFDAVFNHVGRRFWAFRDVQEKGAASPFVGWFQDLRFGPGNPCGDPFTYATWRGYHDLVKLNLSHPDVKNHLFEAVATWVREYDLDGLRLDAADCMDLAFLRELSAWGRSLKNGFWLLGEVIHGDYRKWANPETLDSVTNYEVYKGLYSSLNDKNYFEMAYTLNRQFGENGLYPSLPLYAFADNHDVNRVASALHQARHLYPLYCLLFTLPGVPSIYYGSEWGYPGERLTHTDAPLRPEFDLATLAVRAPHPNLQPVIRRLAGLRRAHPALQVGKYRQLFVGAEQFAFLRPSEQETMLVLLNAAETPATIELKVPEMAGSHWEDVLNPGTDFTWQAGKTAVSVPANWARICVRR